MGYVPVEQTVAIVEATSEAIAKTQPENNYIMAIIVSVISGAILALFTWYLRRNK